MLLYLRSINKYLFNSNVPSLVVAMESHGIIIDTNTLVKF